MGSLGREYLDQGYRLLSRYVDRIFSDFEHPSLTQVLCQTHLDLQQSLSSAAQQKRIGESKVIAARAEVDSAKLMREAAGMFPSRAP